MIKTCYYGMDSFGSNIKCITFDSKVYNRKKIFVVLFVFCGVFAFSIHYFKHGSSVIKEFVGSPIIQRKNDTMEIDQTILKWDDPLEIFFNRIPKTGSTKVIFLLTKLTKHLNFILTACGTFPPGFYFTEPEKEQAYLGRCFNDTTKPSIRQAHLFFVNFSNIEPYSRGEKPLPVYINVVRDPLKRLHSWYYYKRFQTTLKDSMPAWRLNMTYEECIRTRDFECVQPKYYYKQIPFFCGKSEICRTPGYESLSLAKRNVVEYFAVVGYTERLRDFFLALEWALPSRFKGATDLFDLDFKTDRNKSVKKKEDLTEESYNYMMSLLATDYDFYKFIKQRFQVYMKRVNEDLPQSLVNKELKYKKIA